MDIFQKPVWSPGRKWLAYWHRRNLDPEKTEDYRCDLGLVNPDSGERHVLRDVIPMDYVGWEDDDTLLLLEQETADEAAPPDQPTSTTYRFYRVRVQDGAKELVNEFKLEEGFYLNLVGLSRDGWIPFNEGSNWDHLMGLVEPRTGQRISLPEGSGSSMFSYAQWNRELSLIAYASRDASGSALVLAGPSGVVATLALPPNEQLQMHKLSPDGRKVLIATQRIALGFAPLQYKIWDVARDRVTRIRTSNIFHAVASFAATGDRMLWSSDNRRVAFSMLTVDKRSLPRHVQPATMVMLINYEDWAEKELD